MQLRFETAARRVFVGYQDTEVSAFELNWAKAIPRLFPRAIERTKVCPRYNCHGLTFASRRAKVMAKAPVILMLLEDDSLKEVHELRHVLPGDVVVYYPEDESEANHSGIVVEHDTAYGEPLVVSKWGNAGEYIHRLSDCPSIYGPKKKFYRCEP
jgi:hypothetical protein